MTNEGFLLLSKFDPGQVDRDSIRVIAIHHLPLLLLVAVWIIVTIIRIMHVLVRHWITTGHVRCVASFVPKTMLRRCGAVGRVTEELFSARRQETGRHLI